MHKSELPARARRSVLVVAALAAALLGVSSPSAAQRTGEPLLNMILRDDGMAVQLPARRRGFGLFAEEDLAFASLRTTGAVRYAYVNAGGPCPFAQTGGDLFNVDCGAGNFHYTMSWGIGPSDYAKVQEAWPAVANMRPPVGYSTPWRITSLAPITIRMNAADGQFGQFYSGVTSLNGAGCRDHQGTGGASVAQNLTLAAIANCPDTWADPANPSSFDGMRDLPDSVWLQRFNSDKSGFRWDDWRVPRSAFSEKPIGNNSAYGATSDYTRELLQLYGGITPKGKEGAPAGERGFPLGIYVRTDAWKYDRPSLRDGVFLRMLIINNSAKVWGPGKNGRGIDYDEFMFGFDPGYSLLTQFPAIQNIPKLGVHAAMGGGWVTGRCTNTFPKRALPGAAEACFGNTGQNGYLTMILKSPLGDLRNKRFSDPDPSNPYYFPGHPAAGDTITFNHWVRGGFNAQDAFSWRRSDRALWGLMRGDEEAWLDGRPFSDFSAINIWRYFRYEFTDGQQTRANIRFNRSVPSDIAGYGKWDWNHDGVPDTLYLPDCGSLGCSGLWGDSIAGGFSNQSGGNIGNWLGIGPFALKGNDTTEVLMYIGRLPGDTTLANRQIANVSAALFKNFAGASQYPTPVFARENVQLNSAWFRDSTAGNANTEVRIQIKMPTKQDDKFLRSVLDKINENTPVSNTLRALNPMLVQTVTGRMRQNLAQLLVFKSCDNGVSWVTGNTAGTDDCSNATGTFRTRDQNNADIGTGWRPFQTIGADSVTGVLTSYVVSNTVQSGRNYVYSFVTKTRGLFDVKVATCVNGVGVLPSSCAPVGGVVPVVVQDNLQNVFGFDIDTIYSSLSADGPFTVHAYAPISVPAGTLYARLDTSRVQGGLVTNGVTNTARSATIDGTFRMRFGNRFVIIRTLDKSTAARTTRVIRQSLYARGACGTTCATFPAGTAAGVALPNVVAAADTFDSGNDFTYVSPAANALRTTPRTTVGDLETYVDTIALPGYVIAKSSGGTDPYYMVVGASFQGSITQTTADFEGSSWYPGFTATIRSETLAPAARGNNAGPVLLRGALDTLNSTVVNNSGVTYQNQAGLVMRGSPGGYYDVNWSDNAFGPAENKSGFFTFGTYEKMQPVVNASLDARVNISVADTTAATRALIGGLDNLTAARPLVAAKLPFTVVGAGRRLAKVAMAQRHATGNAADSVFRNSRVLGLGGDTTRISIPPDVWMPGDTIYVIEKIEVDSTALVGGIVTPIMRDTTIAGKVQSLPIQVIREVYGKAMVLGCTATRVTCNPVRLGTVGSSAYLPYSGGWVYRMLINRAFDQNSEVKFEAQPVKASALPLSDKDMRNIYAVPNPFVVQGAYDRLTSGRVTDANIIKFINVPAAGVLRIFSVSGQLIQQISWTESDLVASGNGSPHGDLPFNLRTREGLDLMSGLYVFVLKAAGANGNGKVARGKFVVIR